MIAENNIEQLKTPLYSMPVLSARLSIDIYVKHDDYLFSPGGGNKVRKLSYIFKRMIPKNVDVLVTHGGLHSNHARVMALEAAKRGLESHIVLHTENPEKKEISGNALIAKLSGARIQLVTYERLWETVQETMDSLQKEGRKPFLVPGGAHCIEGAWAYADAVEELHQQVADGWVPDFIVHASGTGATQAGIVAGIERIGWPTEVIGISVGRPAIRGKPIVEELYRELREFLKIPGPERAVNFRDDWLCGGYEKFDYKVVDAICLAARTEGLVLDPTYTGKAFAGMMSLIAAGEIPKKAKVIFWHTGGLLNLMAAETSSFENVALGEDCR